MVGVVKSQSVSNNILQYLAKQPAEKLPTLSPSDIAGTLNLPTERVSKLLWSLEHTGRIELIRDGRSVVGIRGILRVEGRQGVRIQRPLGESPKPREVPATVRTPELDKYAAAKYKAAELARGGADDYFTVQFRENPIAEEALKLRDALVRSENQYRELSTQYKVLVYQKAKIEDETRARVAAKVAASTIYPERD